MCGISGILTFKGNKPLEKSNVKKMTDQLVHRGPDDEGYYFGDTIQFGFRRLKIIDLENGNQPMRNDDNSVVMIFNGEIYNYLELKKELSKYNYIFRTKSDTEVILRAYEHYGISFVNKLRGMFAIAIWDKILKKLILLRDRIGQKPLYYASSKKRFYFSSEVKSMLNLPDIKFDLDFNAVNNYFQFSYINSPDSIFSDIRQLPPGCYLETDFENNTNKITKYWTLKPKPDYSKSKNYFIDGVKQILEDSVRLRLQSDVPLGIMLSGGLDSSIITSIASNYNKKIKTFSIGFEDAEFDETRFSQLVSKNFGADHIIDIVDENNVSVDNFLRYVESMDGPFGDSSYIPTYWVSKVAREHVTVALTGDGGDEFFAGYKRYNYLININKYKNFIKTLKFFMVALNNLKSFVPVSISDLIRKINKVVYLNDLSAEDQIKHLVTYFSLEERMQLFDNDLKQMISRNEKLKIDNALDSSDLLNTFLLEDIFNNLSGDLLVKTDRASMANSLEARCPFLDHKLMEFSMTIPPDYKLFKNDNKHILKQGYKHSLPKEIINREKRGFEIPFHNWFKNKAWKNLLLDTLSEDRIKSDNIFNLNTVMYYRDQIIGNPNAINLDISAYQLRQRVYQILVFQIWYDLNIRGEFV